jgi:hypothetical protein
MAASMNKLMKIGNDKLLGKMLLLIATIITIGIEPNNIVVDAYASATNLTPIVVATPSISVATPSGSTPIVTNGNQKTLQAVVGQPVVINVNTSDPNGYNGYVFAGVSQNNLFYYDATQYILVQNAQLYLNPASVNLLPTSSTLLNKKATLGNYTQSTFSWTPTLANVNTSVTVSFIATNYYYPAAPVSQLQSVTINVVGAAESTTPSFSMPAEQTLTVGVDAQIPVTVVPDTDNDNVLISATNLPTGATLGTAAKNASGQWVAVLNWTPTAAQVGSSVINFQAQDAQETAVVTNPVTFVVQNNARPAFSGAMTSLVTAAQNVSLTYKVIVIPDSQTNSVLITATGLPKGATLSKPSLVNGQYIALMTWKPDATQIGSSYPVTFTAEDNVVGAVPVMFTTTFTVTSHFSVINASHVRR